MKCRAMVEHAARNHRHIELRNKGLQVQRLAVLRDAFGRNDGALNDQQVDARGDQRRRE